MWAVLPPGAEHPVARLHGQQMRSKLRSCILNGTQPVGKAGNAVDGDGRDEFDGLGADSAGFKPCSLQPVKIVFDGHEADVDAQRHRRMTRAQLQNAVRILWINRADAANPPSGSIEADLVAGGDLLFQFILLAQIAAEHGVDEA